MTQKLAATVAWSCVVWLAVVPIAALYFLIEIDAFSALAARNLNLPIQWFTVGSGQWLALWAVTALYFALAYAGVWYLHKAFRSFARGHWFDVDNSRSLRRFALILILQGITRPIHLALASVILSVNHPPGEQLLSLMVGSREIWFIVAGFIMWVLANLLVEGAKATAENRQFV